MQKFFKLFGTLVAMLALAPDQRDEDNFAKTLKEAKEFIESDEAKEYEQFGEMKAKLVQLQADHDKTVEELRELGKRRITLPTFTGKWIRPGVPLWRFSHPDLAKEFADFCFTVRKCVRGESKDLTPVDDSEGGYLIPEAQIEAEINAMTEAVGIGPLIARPVPMGPGGFKQARRLGGAEAYFKAAGAAGTESTPSFGMIDMQAETLIAIVDVDLELDEDSKVELGNYLASEFAYAMARKKDQVAFVGTGSPADGGVTGILNSDRVTVVTMGSGDTGFANISYDDLVDLESNAWEGAVVNARWLMHRTIKGLVKKLKDTANMPIWNPTVGPEPDDLLGYPLQTAGLMRALSQSAVSTTFAAFGDFRSGLYYGRRGGLRIDFSDHAGYKNYQRVWRGIERMDIQVNGYTASEISSYPELANPITVLKTAAS